MTYRELFYVVVSAMFLNACALVRSYDQPKDDQAHALLKLKYKYSRIVAGSTIGARLDIMHDAKSGDERYRRAFEETYGNVQKGASPDIPMAAVKVHPGKKTEVSMAVYFYWYTPQPYTIMVNNMPQTQMRDVYTERGCTAQVGFVPEAGKSYILDYSSPSVDRDCRVSVYEQVPQAGGKFKLVNVGRTGAQ